MSQVLFDYTRQDAKGESRVAHAWARVPASATLELLPDYCFSQALVRFGFLGEEPHTADSLQARPLWTDARPEFARA